MDVLHLCHQFAPETRGGVEAYVADLVLAQRAAGQDVHVLTGSHAPWPAIGIEELQVDGVRVHRLHRDDLFFDYYGKAWHPGVERTLAAFVQHQRPKVVHVHQWIRLVPNLVEVVQRAGIPVVVTLHDYYASCPRAFRLRRDGSACLRPLSPDSCRDCVPRYGHEAPAEVDATIALFAAQSRAELTMADAVLVGVASTADLVAASLGLPRERFAVQSLGYRRRFPGLPQLPAPAAAAPLRFAFWGGVAPHKGIRELVTAMRLLVAAAPPRACELHVLGGFATPELEAELRVAGRGLPITFHGPFRTEQLRELRPAVGVFPSTCLETFGIVLDECFELGLPCVVSDRGALPERVGNAGLVARAGDADDLAAKMAMLLDVGTWTNLRSYVMRPTTSIERYCGELEWIYEEAHARAADEDDGAAPRPAPLPEARRLQFLLRQRESALSRIVPEGGPR